MQYFSADPCLIQQMNTYAVFSLLAPQSLWPQIENCSVLHGHLSRVPQYSINAFFLKSKTKGKIYEAVLLFHVVLLSYFLKGE